MTDKFELPPMIITPGFVAIFRNCNNKKIVTINIIGIQAGWFIVEYQGELHTIHNLKGWKPALTFQRTEWRINNGPK